MPPPMSDSCQEKKKIAGELPTQGQSLPFQVQSGLMSDSCQKSKPSGKSWTSKHLKLHQKETVPLLLSTTSNIVNASNEHKKGK